MKLKLLVLDVDGTMTDAGIYYDDNGNELKKFCTKDALGFFASKVNGIKIMVLTGRECMATTRRMKELNVDYLYQNIKDKYSFLKDFAKENGIKYEEIGYIGDDLNDLKPMQLAGFKACPKDSRKEIIKIADYVSDVSGGHGVISDVVEYILSEDKLWDKTINMIFDSGI